MASKVRSAVAPAYLLMCLVLGGSSQGIFLKMVLQLAGIAILAWAALARDDRPITAQQFKLFGCILLGLLVVLVQLIPLPATVWENLPGRGAVAEGYHVLWITPPWLPVSLAPYDTVATLLTLIPPLAMLAAMLRLGSRRVWLILALIGGTMAGIVLGALQVSSADPVNSPWYPYAFSNFGVATGFFANANHMAILLVICLPFLAAVVASARGREDGVQRYSAVVALVAGAALVIAVGLALNGSLAGYGIALPVLVASALIIIPRNSAASRWMIPLAGVLLIVAIAAIALRPIGANLKASAETSVQSREMILKTSIEATTQLMPFGSGAGSFENVYHLYEDHERLDPNTVVNHAHNDYVEIAMETGVPGLIVLALFLAWWANAVWRVWNNEEGGPYARAAAVASAAILAHSVVDFPLRTAAISACFAMCLGLLTLRRAPKAADSSSLWPTRHVVVG